MIENKKILTFLFLLIIIVILGVVIWGSRNKKTNFSFQSSVPIFFYGNSCFHCANVEEWMEKNKIEKKIKIIKKEVYDNQDNAKELVEAARKCGLSTNSIGVPFLFVEGKCLIGAADVIDFLSKKAGLGKK